MENIIEVNDSNIDNILETDKLVVLKFGANWCGPCQILKPVMKELSKDESIVIGEIDVDSNSQSTVKYGIRGIPATLFFKNGQILDRKIGAASKKEFSDIINKYN